MENKILLTELVILGLKYILLWSKPVGPKNGGSRIEISIYVLISYLLIQNSGSSSYR